MMRRTPLQHHNYPIHRERDRRALKRQSLLLGCGLLLVVGFVIAARLQVTATQYGYKSEELRRERARLLEEQQRLLLALEETASPAQLERAARKLGLQPTRPAQLDAAKDRRPDAAVFTRTASAAMRR